MVLFLAMSRPIEARNFLTELNKSQYFSFSFSLLFLFLLLFIYFFSLFILKDNFYPEVEQLFHLLELTRKLQMLTQMLPDSQSLF